MTASLFGQNPRVRIEAIEIDNFKVFRKVSLRDLPSYAVIIGANGTGKSTWFDVLGFLRDALQDNVHVALRKRGGFREVVTRDSEGPIRILLKFREGDGPLVTYELTVGERDGRGVVEREVLKYRRGRYGMPWKFLDFQHGSGTAITNEESYDGKADTEIEREEQQLESPSILALKGLGQFQRFQVASTFRRLIEGWHLSDLHVGDARPAQEHGYAEHLSARGDNLAVVAQYLFEHHADTFQHILDVMKQRVPGVTHVEAEETLDGRLVLRFQDGAFKDPFVARNVSDGTIKMFAYLVLLHDPEPHPLLCIEEPENQLYPTLLRELSEEFQMYARRGGQVMVSTHSPDFLNGVPLDSILWLRKHEGCTVVERARDNPLLQSLVAEGDLPGALWKQRLFEGVDP